MSLRSVVVVVVALAAVLLAYFNWAALSATPPAVFGPWVLEVPVGWLMLAVLALLSVLFVAYVASLQADRLLEMRRHARDLQQQRERAEQAEAVHSVQRLTGIEAQLQQLHKTLEAGLDRIESRAVAVPAPAAAARVHPPLSAAPVVTPGPVV